MKNAAEFYDQMKAALEFFGLRFHDMDKMSLTFIEGACVFSYGADSITVRS